MRYDMGQTNEYNLDFDEQSESTIKMPTAFDDVSAKVTISEEGLDYYRESVTAMEATGNQRIEEDRPPNPQNIYMDIENNIYEMLVMKTNKLNSVDSNGGGVGSTYGFLSAYASMYDEIMRGYEDGTREYWVRSENGYRQVTKEEELTALNKAVEKGAEFIATSAKEEEVVSKLWEQVYAGIDRQKGAVHHNGSLAEDGSKLLREQTVDVKAIYKEMLMGTIKTIQSQYSAFAGDLKGLVNNALNSNISISIR